MRFKLPRLPHGWRAFFGEVGIIVLGVLIALGAQQLVEDWQWRRQAEQAKHAIEAELMLQEVDGYERLAVQPCLRGQIRKLYGGLKRHQGHWKATPMVVRQDHHPGAAQRVVDAAYRAPGRLWFDEAWETARSSGALNHLPDRLVADYAEAYNRGTRIFQVGESEAAAASSLSALAVDGAIDNDSRVRLIGALAQVDRDNSYIEITVREELKKLSTVLRDIPRRQREEAIAARIRNQNELRGGCVLQLRLQ